MTPAEKEAYYKNLRTTLERYPEIKNKIKKVIEKATAWRVKHFRERIKERWNVGLSVTECVDLEYKIMKGEGRYIEGYFERGNRELRVMRIKGARIPIVYCRDDYGLITCLPHNYKRKKIKTI